MSEKNSDLMLALSMSAAGSLMLALVSAAGVSNGDWHWFWIFPCGMFCLMFVMSVLNAIETIIRRNDKK